MSEEEDAVRRALTMRVLNMPQRDPWVGHSSSASGYNTAPIGNGQSHSTTAGDKINNGNKAHSSVSAVQNQESAQVLDSNSDADVLLESLHLSPDASSVDGTVRVRNIAFEKNVAVRFTFDDWQMTSEVLARWVESVVTARSSGSVMPQGGVAAMLPNMTSTSPPMSAFEGGSISSFYSSSVSDLGLSGSGSDVAINDNTTSPSTPSNDTYDRFAFTIRLADMLLRIEEKTLVLAVRYRAAGREVWDNNGGENYKAVFARRAVVVDGNEEKEGLGLVPKKVESGSDDDEVKLKNKPKFDDVKSGMGINSNYKFSNPTSTHSNSIDRDRSLEALVSPTKKPRSLSGSGSGSGLESLASRYDLGASLRDKTPFSRPTVESISFQPFKFPGSGPGAFPDSTRTPHTSAHGHAHAYGRGRDKTFSTHTVLFPISTRGLQQQAIPRGSPREFGSAEAEAARDDVLALVQKRRVGMAEGPEEGAGEGAYRLGYYQQVYPMRPSTRPATQSAHPTRPRAHFRSHTGMTGYFDNVPFGSGSGSAGGYSPSSTSVGAGAGAVSPASARAAGFGATQVRLTPPGSPGLMAMGLLQPPNFAGEHPEHGFGLGKGHRALSFDSAGLSLPASSPTTPSCEVTPRAGFGSQATIDVGTDAGTATSTTSTPSIAAWNAGGHFWAGGLGIAVPSSTTGIGADGASTASGPTTQASGVGSGVLDSPSEVSTPSSMATASAGTSPTMTSPASPPDLDYAAGGLGMVGTMKMRESMSLDSAAYGALFHR